ncbi:hypothetical protein AV920_0200905 [Helicobacter pylori]|nr:hypothetical protein AV923_0200905 [Helicobacter pylori]OJZ99343.1 hypothetical protein AV920_0200905 [Helicobacter pylori]TPI00833.1 hypothetical protein FIM37_01260 [Helicobacter pylori]
MQSILKKIPLSFNGFSLFDQEKLRFSWLNPFLFDSSLSFKVSVSFYLFIIFELILLIKGFL